MKNVLYVNFKTRLIVETRNETVNTLDEVKNTFRDEENIFDRFTRVVTQLANRYGENQPKGGVIVKSATYKNGDEISLESYGRGDVHNSLHKHEVKTKLEKTGNWNRPTPFPVDLKAIDKVLSKNKNKTLVMGQASDPFQWIDLRYRNTHSTLQLANKYNVKLKIETMSDLCAHDEYIDLLIDGGHHIIMHLGVHDVENQENYERLLSPGAPSINRRRAAVAKLISLGIEVTIKTVTEQEMSNAYPSKNLSMLGIPTNKTNVR